MSFSVPKIRKLLGEFTPPPDKSISHRALILGAIAEGETEVHNSLDALDIDSTSDALKYLGVRIVKKENLCLVS